MIFTSVFFFVIVIGSIILIKLYVPENVGTNTPNPLPPKISAPGGEPSNGVPRSLSVALMTPVGSFVPGVSQIISGIVKGGVPPFNYTFIYTSNGLSNCINGKAIFSNQQAMDCSFSFSTSGTVTLTVVDGAGSVATSQMVRVLVTKPTPTPVEMAVSTPEPSIEPTPFPEEPDEVYPTPKKLPTKISRPKKKQVSVKCGPISVGFTCAVRWFCPKDLFKGMGPEMVVKTNFNATKSPGAVVKSEMGNTTLLSGQGVRNFKFTVPYSLTCDNSGKWTGNGSVFCQVDKLLSATDPICIP